jgi:uncharacterized protein (TIGR03083 family)
VNGSLSRDDFLTAFHREWTDLHRAAGGVLGVTVPSCPEWSVATLVGHVGEAYTYVRLMIEAGGEDNVNELEDLGLPPDIENWFRADLRSDSIPDTLLEWLGAAARSLEESFADTEPGAPAWTWWEPDQTAGFWLRRMAQETSVHRWDVEAARGEPEPIEAGLAADGIDEMLDIYTPRWCRPKSGMTGSGESYCLRRSDEDTSWTVRFPDEGVEVTKGDGRAQVTVTGSASDLILALWGRIPFQQLAVEGDAGLLDRWFQLVPPD